MPVVDLFCGCGGLSTGFTQAGFDIVASYDNWETAINCYNHNIQGNHAVQLNLGDVNNAVAIINAHAPNIIIGSPPCQEFSNAGRRIEGEKSDLTYKYAEIVTEILPNFFVMENVPRAMHSNAYAKARELYIAHGYGLTEVILDASRCGVPQHRSRFFSIGALNNPDNFLLGNIFSSYIGDEISVEKYYNNHRYKFNFEAYYRHPTTYNRRAIFGVNEVSPTIRGVNRPRPATYKWHEGDAVTEDQIQNTKRLSTIDRARIQTFPEGFEFDGLGISLCDIEQMIGNAVPVQLAEFMAECLQQYIGGDHMDNEREFAQWLRSTKGYTDRTISDIFSRISRAKNYLPTTEITRYFIVDLEDVPEFIALEASVKSQIRSALRKKIEFDNFQNQANNNE